MDNYEYLVTESPFDAYTGAAMTKWLNELGSQGWRLMNVPDDVGNWWYFERNVGTRLTFGGGPRCTFVMNGDVCNRLKSSTVHQIGPVGGHEFRKDVGGA